MKSLCDEIRLAAEEEDGFNFIQAQVIGLDFICVKQISSLRQQGFHFMTAGAMSALRNPKAHSNDEVLTAEEALRRLMFASMLMYKLDEAGL